MERIHLCAYQHPPRGATWTPRDGELTPFRNGLTPFGKSRFAYIGRENWFSMFAGIVWPASWMDIKWLNCVQGWINFWVLSFHWFMILRGRGTDLEFILLMVPKIWPTMWDGLFCQIQLVCRILNYQGYTFLGNATFLCKQNGQEPNKILDNLEFWELASWDEKLSLYRLHCHQIFMDDNRANECWWFSATNTTSSHWWPIQWGI